MRIGSLAGALAVELFARVWCSWSQANKRVILAMFPRGPATTVMAFLPAHAGIPATELFPLYALILIGFSVMCMTIGLAMERRRLPAVDVAPRYPNRTDPPMMSYSASQRPTS